MNNNTFVLEYEIGLNKKDRDIIESKIRIAKSIYNATLNTCKKRIDNYKKDCRYIEINNKLKYANKKIDQELIEKLNLEKIEILKKYNWIDISSLNEFKKKQVTHFNNALNVSLVNKIVNKAYNHCLKYELENKPLKYVDNDSNFMIESTNNKTGMYFKEGELCFNAKTKLEAKPIRRDYLKYYYEASKNEILYCRLVAKIINKKKRYFVQVIYKGIPPVLKKYSEDTIYINDIDEHRIVLQKNDQKIGLLFNKKTYSKRSKKINKLIERYDRLMKLNNPDNYYKNGRVKKGNLKWNISNSCIKVKKQIHELRRYEKQLRTVQYNEICNDIFKDGTNIILRKTSFKNPKVSSEFLKILERKLSYIGKSITYMEG